MDDKLLEVVGLYSSFHVGRIQISVAEPLRIGQSNDIKVKNLPLEITQLHILIDYTQGECSSSSGWGTMATRTFYNHYISQRTNKYVEKSELLNY